MHEYGLCEGVLATVRQRAAGRQVAGIRVRFGVRHAVDSESLAQAFSFVAEGTEAAGAAVDLVTVPATLSCRSCGHTEPRPLTSWPSARVAPATTSRSPAATR